MEGQQTDANDPILAARSRSMFSAITLPEVIIVLICCALMYLVFQRPLGLSVAPPGAAADVMTMNRWGAVPNRILEVARDDPTRLSRAQYRSAAQATYMDCMRYADSLHTTYADLRSEPCDVAASVLATGQ